jgi:hypothetical protein
LINDLTTSLKIIQFTVKHAPTSAGKFRCVSGVSALLRVGCLGNALVLRYFCRGVFHTNQKNS